MNPTAIDFSKGDAAARRKINDGDLKCGIKSTRRKTDRARCGIQSSLRLVRNTGGGGHTAMMNRGRRVTLSEFVCRPPGAKSDAATACLIKYFTLMKNGRAREEVVPFQPSRRNPRGRYARKKIRIERFVLAPREL